MRSEVELLLACSTETQASQSNAGPDNSDDATDVSDAPPRSPAAVGARICPKCQMSFPTDVYFCHNDGEPLVANPEVLVGTLFDEIYEIEALLGEGGMGTVYRARHRLLRDIVALKMLRGDDRENLRWRRRFVREGQAARRFRHSNSVTVYDLRTSRDGTIYLVLEYVPGVTLRTRLREKRRYTCLDALRILEPLASVLDTAHLAGVVHRDLKPENVMLVDDGYQVKLLDLGIAGFLGTDASNGETAKLTQAGTFLGTPRYMSPEQWGELARDGVAGVDGRADVYSMGIMVFELVTGRAPFRGNEASELRQFHLNEPPPDPRVYNSVIPEEFARAILVAISKDRADRFDSPGAFVRTLSASLGRSTPSTSEEAFDLRVDGRSPTASTPLLDGQTITDTVATLTKPGPAETLEDPPTNLPQSLTSFVGRHAEVEAVVDALRMSRLVTLVGPGGIGKTRLAVQAGREAFDDFPDGVWLADLSTLTHEALVVPSVGRVLELSDRVGDNPEDAVADAIGTRRLLLVLDNCEHVLNAVRPLADEILRRCTRARVLATSREALGLVGEYAREVPALAVPELAAPPGDMLVASQSSEAVLLFVERARAVRADFRLTEQNVMAVVAVCRRLDGIPLAVELAAARTVVMSPAQLLVRLEKSMDLLASRHVGIPDRHRTLRASIEWSYQLLAPHLREVFGRLSVFRGGWTLEAAEAVFSSAENDGVATVDALEQLASSSLIVTDEGVDEIRFRMLETIREYSTGLVASELRSSLRAEHARYFRAFVETADEKLAGREQHRWLSRVAADLDNVRAALDWSREVGESDIGLAIAASMGRFWTVRGFVSEGLAALRDVLDRATQASPRGRAKALNWAGNLAAMAGDVVASRAWQEEALGIRRAIGDQSGVAASLHNLGGLAADQGDFALADRLYEECTTIATEIGDNLRLALALVNRGRAANERGLYAQAFDLLQHGIDLLDLQGHTYGTCIGLLCLGDAQMCSGDLERAEGSFQRCLGLANEMGERTASGFALCGLGSIARYRGSLEPARAYAERAVAIARDLGAEDLHATALALLGEIAVLGGDVDQANRLLRQSLRIRSARNLRSGIASSLEGLAHASLAAGRHERAARFLGAAAALRELIGVPVPAIDLSAVKDATSSIRQSLGDEAFVAARTTGAELPLNDLRADVID
ncbi:MAG: protein kinase [Blastocatellia bacterium]|nr:protein kinase [Blastocatellia bacterium]